MTERQLLGDKVQGEMCWHSRKEVTSINNTEKFLLP